MSVVLCSYNGEKYIEAQLESIQWQSHAPLEIIVQDDGSTDATVQIVEMLRQSDNRIKLFQNPVNLGFNRNFETAFTRAGGEWIAVSDQDDIWHPDKLKTMLAAHDGRSVLIHCDSVLFSGTPDCFAVQPASWKRFAGRDVRQLFVQNTVEGHTMLFRKELLAQAVPFPEGVFYDWWLGYCAGLDTGVQWQNRTLAWRRIHDSNQTLGPEKNVSKLLNTFRVFAAHPRASAAQQAFAHELAGLIEGRDTAGLRTFLWRHRHLVFFFRQYGWKTPLKHYKKIRELLRDWRLA